FSVDILLLDVLKSDELLQQTQDEVLNEALEDEFCHEVAILRDGRIKVIDGDNIEGLLISPKQLPSKYLEGKEHRQKIETRRRAVMGRLKIEKKKGKSENLNAKAGSDEKNPEHEKYVWLTYKQVYDKVIQAGNSICACGYDDDGMDAQKKSNKVIVPVIATVASFFMILTALTAIWIIRNTKSRGAAVAAHHQQGLANKPGQYDSKVTLAAFKRVAFFLNCSYSTH
ncbi:hypothetical protein Tco_1379353, partial [Tanacetum coccineum]